jgi:hypothetical protein
MRSRARGWRTDSGERALVTQCVTAEEVPDAVQARREQRLRLELERSGCKRPLVHRVAEKPVVGQPARHDVLALADRLVWCRHSMPTRSATRTARDARRSHPRTWRRGDHRGREGSGRSGRQGTRCRPRLGWRSAAVPGCPQQQRAHAPLPHPPLGADDQQLGRGRPDGVCLGPNKVVACDEVVGGQRSGHLLGKPNGPAMFARPAGTSRTITLRRRAADAELSGASGRSWCGGRRRRRLCPAQKWLPMRMEEPAE